MKKALHQQKYLCNQNWEYVIHENVIFVGKIYKFEFINNNNDNNNDDDVNDDNN